MSYLYGWSEGWDLASDSAYQVQIQSFDRMSSFSVSHHIQLNISTVGLSRDIAAGNQCAPF